MVTPFFFEQNTDFDDKTQPESTISNYLSLPPDPTRTMNEQEMLAKSSILFERTNLVSTHLTFPYF